MWSRSEMPQRQVKSLLTSTYCFFLMQDLLSSGKSEILFFCMRDSSCLKKMHFACMVSCTLLPALTGSQGGLAFCGGSLLAHSCQGAAPAGLQYEPWTSCWFHYMQTSTLIFSVEVAARVSMPLTEAVAISWWLWWRMPVCTWCVPFCSSWAKSSS